MPPRVAPVASRFALVRMLRSLRSRTSSLTLPSSRISSEDPSDQFSFFFNDGNLAVLHLIAEGQGASNPQTLPLGGRDLVADPLGGNFPLKLGKGQEHVERQPPHRGRGVELLCDRDE